MINQHLNGQKLINELQDILGELHRYATTVDHYVLTATLDLDGKITSVSRAFCQASGYTEAELIGQDYLFLKYPQSDESCYEEFWETLNRGKTWSGELEKQDKQGHRFWVQVSAEPVYDSDRKCTGYISIQQDITDKKRIEELTITDDLTGAFNRRYFDQNLKVEMDRARRSKHFLCMLMIDADNFKSYNDTYGHQAGDWVLKGIVTQMKETFKRAGDSCYRLGGEEFAVLFHTQSPEQAEQVSNSLRQAIFDNNIEHSGNPPHQRLTISGGLMALDPKRVYIEEEIYKYADEALYRAKKQGRNRIEIHTEGEIELF